MIGALVYNESGPLVGTKILKDEIKSGRFKYRPNISGQQNQNSTSSFTYKVSDWKVIVKTIQLIYLLDVP